MTLTPLWNDYSIRNKYKDHKVYFNCEMQVKRSDWKNIDKLNTIEVKSKLTSGC